MSQSRMRRFWDNRAEEDAFFFVDNRLQYRQPDLEQFWADGQRDLDNLLNALGASIQSSDSVLEIGCGVGRLTRVLAERAQTVQALDVSPRMLEIARQQNPGLANVEWLLGDGSTLAGIETGSIDACVSHVVFQHIPDPEITLGYVREIGRVLRPDGWAAFQISNDPGVHTQRGSLRQRLRALLGRAPRGQTNPSWLGSMVELEALQAAAANGSMQIQCVVGAGTQYCCVLTRRTADA